MLEGLLNRIEAELVSRDPRISGLDIVCFDENRGRVQLAVTVVRDGREMQLPVSVSMGELTEDEMSRTTGIILQTVDLSTWGKHDFKMRESVKVTA
ncbi:hypothetical protein SAMN05660649_01983 [Desulfotomaculum arcticum]|uniref:Uncharacterized protein n=1 Tax=Desulfotruncus arcticus DSM 17038 TaxID=1121424 RepID=A0A1I2SVA9_9FIRM|nr:hypothetical protein [Desulfotruncus arcticus]SFG55799.1 hypothetical protein SAMN05660649_01983 [Desulfotomaculum arcticum] [Desulfotruncus arcticus DSM 17038]